MKLTEDIKKKYKTLKNKTAAAIDAFCGYKEETDFSGFSVEPENDPFNLEDIISQSIQRRITDFSQMAVSNGRVSAMDAKNTAMDDGETIALKNSVNNRFNQYDGRNITDTVLSYYASKGFMGYQCYAILGQNKWISKALCMPVKDALRPGFIFTKEEKENGDNTIDNTEEIIQKFESIK